MKLKKLMAIIVCVVICIMPLSGFAAAETLSGDYQGNADHLIDIKNPEEIITSTTSKVCVISAVAVPDTTVTLYSLNEESGKYVKMYSDGAALEKVVGAAGLYAQSINLKTGVNNILVVAQSGNSVEAVKLQVTLVKSSLSDALRNIWQTIVG